MKATLHWWTDGSVVVSFDEGASSEAVHHIREAIREGRDERLLVFPFPVEVIEHPGPLTVPIAARGEDAE